jgi:hypothetical protein
MKRNYDISSTHLRYLEKQTEEKMIIIKYQNNNEDRFSLRSIFINKSTIGFTHSGAEQNC